MEKKIIIFDFDGTLWDTTDLVLTLIRNMRISPLSQAEVQELYSHNIGISLANLNKYNPLKNPGEIEKLILSYQEAKLNTTPFPGIREALELLKENGLNLAVVTMARRDNCLPLLRKYDFEKYFKYIQTREDSLNKIGSVAMILEKENLKIEEVIFVTDTLGDVREMNVLGVETVAVTYGVHDRSFFEREKNENLIAVVETVEDLKNKLLELKN